MSGIAQSLILLSLFISRESTMSKKTKTKRAKTSKSTKTSGSRDASSPIYKYTEVDYNPMGF